MERGEMITVEQAATVVEACFMWNYNTPVDKRFSAVYDTPFDWGDAYCHEKACVMQDLYRWWSVLDKKHRKRLVQAALAYYNATGDKG